MAQVPHDRLAADRATRLDVPPNQIADIRVYVLLRDAAGNVARFSGSRLIQRVGIGSVKQLEDGYFNIVDGKLHDEDETNQVYGSFQPPTPPNTNYSPADPTILAIDAETIPADNVAYCVPDIFDGAIAKVERTIDGCYLTVVPPAGNLVLDWLCEFTVVPL